MKTLLLSCCLFITYLNTFCQNTTNISVSFSAVFNGFEPLILDSAYVLKNSSSIKFETLKYYVSALQFIKNNEVVFTEKNSFHLIDIAHNSSQTIEVECLHKINFDKIQFNVGIDSVTNCAGAMAGDLDPTKGMYWTWQSGYINFKLEGASSQCTRVNNQFQLHLGGYQAPCNALQKVALNVVPKNKIPIYFDLKQFVEMIDLSTQHHVMSANSEALMLSKQVANCFKTND